MARSNEVSRQGALGVARRAFESWSDHRTIRLGAGLAYYSLFAWVPLVAVSLFVAGLIFSEQDIGSYLVEMIGEAAGSEAACTAADLLTQLELSMSTSGSGVVLFVATVITASFVFVALQDVMNLIWEVPPRHGLRSGLRRRVFAFGRLNGTDLEIHPTEEIRSEYRPATLGRTGKLSRGTNASRPRALPRDRRPRNQS